MRALFESHRTRGSDDARDALLAPLTGLDPRPADPRTRCDCACSMSTSAVALPRSLSRCWCSPPSAPSSHPGALRR